MGAFVIAMLSSVFFAGVGVGVDAFFTVTLQVAFFLLPSFAVAVIVAVPALTPVTTPLEVTLAILLLEVFQVTALSVAFFGVTVALSVTFLPT